MELVLQGLKTLHTARTCCHKKALPLLGCRGETRVTCLRKETHGKERVLQPLLSPLVLPRGRTNMEPVGKARICFAESQLQLHKTGHRR